MDRSDQKNPVELFQRIIPVAKNFKDLKAVEAKDMTRDQAMIFLLNFFNSKISAANRYTVTKVNELMSIHNITMPELVDKYVRLVHENF